MSEATVGGGGGQMGNVWISKCSVVHVCCVTVRLRVGGIPLGVLLSIVLAGLAAQHVEQARTRSTHMHTHNKTHILTQLVQHNTLPCSVEIKSPRSVLNGSFVRVAPAHVCAHLPTLALHFALASRRTQRAYVGDENGYLSSQGA